MTTTKKTTRKRATPKVATTTTKGKAPTTPDIYDREVERLKGMTSEQLHKVWQCDEETERPGSPLFAYCTTTREASILSNWGCLTQVRHCATKKAQTPALTKAIKADPRIPDFESITPASLPVFAEWQRRIDKELGREVPSL